MSDAANATPVSTPAPANTQAAPISDTNPTEATEQVTQPKPELFEVKINGKVRKYTLDELKAKASLGEAAHEKFEQASKLGKEHTEMTEKMKKDFLEVLTDPKLGLTKDQIRTRFESWYKENFIDPETMTEEQRELAKYRKLEKEREEAKKRDEEEQKKVQETEQEKAERETLQQEIIGALDKSGLPKSRFTVGRMAYWMKQNLAKGYDAPMEVIVQQVKDERHQIVTNLISSSSADQLVDMLGEDVVKKIRQYDLARLKKRFEPETNGETPPTQETPRNRRQGKKTMAEVDEYFNNLRRSK